VLEAAAAGRPLIATRVGGIPEIFGPQENALVAPDDSVALAGAIRQVLDDPQAAEASAGTLQSRVAADFSVDVMVDNILAAYRQELQQELGQELRHELGHELQPRETR